MSVHDLVTAVYLTLPLIVSGILHMAIVKLDLLPQLKRPIAEHLFGKNKTWRGIIAVPVFTVLGVAFAIQLEPSFSGLRHLLSSLSLIPAGLILGLGYVLPELPNSWFKRKMGVPPGKLPEKNKLLFFFLDHFDSVTGCTIAYAILFQAITPAILLVLVIGPGVHTGVSLLLWLARLRKNPV